MTARKIDQINLLPEKGFETSTAGRILSWILSTFRIIVIVTEVIVMIAFLSRFWLDAQNTDLTDEIEQKQAVLSASLDFENTFKDTQKRLKIFSEMTLDESRITDTIKALTSYLPDDLFLTSVTLDFQKEVDIEGSTPNERSIQQFLVNLSATDKFGEIGISEIKTNPKDVSLLDFKIKALLK